MHRHSSLPDGIRLLFVMLLMLAFTRPAACAAVNRLANPGFEDGIAGHAWMPAAWDTSRSGLSSVFFGRDTLLARTGHYAVTVANVSGLWPFSHNWSQAILVNREDWGKDAVFSVWTRNTGIDGRAYVLLQAYRDTLSRLSKERGVTRDSLAQAMHINPIDDPLYDLGWKRQQFTDEETGWVRREVRVFVPPLTNMIFARCGLIGTGQLTIDDASLTFEPAKPAPPATPGVNLLAEPGFEERGLAWEFSLPPYKNMIGRADSSTAHSGRYCLMFTGGEEGWVSGHAGACQAIPSRALQGKRIRLTGWFKTDSLNGSVYTQIYFHTLHGVVQMVRHFSISGTKDWTKSIDEATVPKDAYETWVWYCYDAPITGRMYVDDCALEVVAMPKADEKKAGAR